MTHVKKRSSGILAGEIDIWSKKGLSEIWLEKFQDTLVIWFLWSPQTQGQVSAHDYDRPLHS